MIPKSAQNYRSRLKQPNVILQCKAQEELACVAEKVPELLRNLARDVHPMVRMRAGYAMGWSKERQFLPDLIRLLGDPVHLVRYDAGWALGHLGRKEAVPFLLREHRVSHNYQFSYCRSNKRWKSHFGWGHGFGSWRHTSGSCYGLQLLGPQAWPSLKTALRSSHEADLIAAIYALRDQDPEYFRSLARRFATHPKVGHIYRDNLKTLDWPTYEVERKLPKTAKTRFGRRRPHPKPRPMLY